MTIAFDCAPHHEQIIDLYVNHVMRVQDVAKVLRTHGYRATGNAILVYLKKTGIDAFATYLKEGAS
jgi:hypothetical protein